MGAEVRLWQIGREEELTEISRARLDLESRLQEWLAADIAILDPGLLVVGREVETDFGGFIDILCIDAEGDLVLVELKRDRTPREVTAQALDYASWVTDLSNDRISAIADAHLDTDLEDAFRTKFGAEVPETLNGSHRILVVGSEVDASSERIMRYLSEEHGVNINAATFHYFRAAAGAELLARIFLLEPSEVDRQARTKGGSKRRASLTFEELEALAADAGVAELYNYAKAAFAEVLWMHRTRSSIAFTGNLDGSRRVVISFRPGDSNSHDGLRFQLYKQRFAELAEVPSSAIDDVMPRRREDWSYGGETDPLWRGFEGFITDRDEIDRLAGALKRAADEAPSGP